MKTYGLYIQTFGCQMNVYDTDQIYHLLYPLGFRKADSIKHADLIIINTCSIRHKAEQKVYSFLGRLTEKKKVKPHLIIAVGGCVAQQEGKKICGRLPHVDLVFGTHQISQLPEMINMIMTTPIENRKNWIKTSFQTCLNELNITETVPLNAPVTDFITIMRGCDNYCTYCVVPYVRGREMSRHPDMILEEIKRKVKAGTREITLLGQNVNSYGQKENLCSFAELLARVNAIEGLKRIRFTTSHPKDLSDDLIHAFQTLDKLCAHFHLPVQSGSDTILKRMNRKYTRQIYLKRIEALRRVKPNIAITSDIIVGFPGETHDDYKETRSLISEVNYDNLFIFKYSDRPIAPASQFDPKVDESEKLSRLQELLALQANQTQAHYQNLCHTTQTVLVEGNSRKNITQWSGRTTGNYIVNFTCSKQPPIIGQLVDVKINEACAHSLRGNMIESQ